MSSTHTQSQFCTATLISSFLQSSCFSLAIAFVSRHTCFKLNLTQVIRLVVEMVLATEGFLEVTIANLPPTELSGLRYNWHKGPII